MTRQEADVFQEFNPRMRGSRALGMAPVAVLKAAECIQRGQRVLREEMLNAVASAALCQLIAIQIYGGLAASTVFAVVEACLMATISVRSRNDSRLYGLREISAVLLFLFALWAAFDLVTNTRLHQLAFEYRTNVGDHSTSALLRLLLTGFEDVIVLAAVLVGYLSIFTDQPYERPSPAYRYMERQEPYARPIDGFVWLLGCLLPFIYPQSASIVSVGVCWLLALSVGLRYAYVATAEAIDIIAADSPQLAGIQWFSWANAERHFLFLTALQPAFERLLSPTIHWGYASRIQIAFLGYNHEQYRSDAHYQLSPSVESAIVRLGLVRLTIATFSLALFRTLAYLLNLIDSNLLPWHVARFPNVVVAIATTLIGICLVRLWLAYLFGVICNARIKTCMSVLLGKDE